MPRTAVDRRTAIADAGIRVLAESGSRGLTHRAVDQALGLPKGSTANYFPTRSALVMACAERLAALDLAEMTPEPPALDAPLTPEATAELVTATLLSRLDGAARIRTIARLELSLGSPRAPELSDLLHDVRRRFTAVIAAGLRAAGSRDPDRDAQALIAFFDGLLFDQLLYPQTAVDRDRLADHLTAFIRACVS